MLLNHTLSLRAQRRLCYSAASLCVVVTAVLWGWLAWPESPQDFPPASGPRVAVRPTALVPVPSDAEVRRLAMRRLRQPLVDPPPVAKTSQPKRTGSASKSKMATRAPRLRWRLVGTVLEAQHSTAILIDPRGQIRVVREGEPLPETPRATLVKVERSQVVVALGTRRVELRLARESGADQ